jgi:hypothetical protein
MLTGEAQDGSQQAARRTGETCARAGDSVSDDLMMLARRTRVSSVTRHEQVLNCNYLYNSHRECLDGEIDGSHDTSRFGSLKLRDCVTTT